MARTEIRGGQIKDDSITGDDIDESTLILDQIRDADGDTKVQVEESADEDKIRFDVAGSEKMVLDGTGFGIGTSSPTSPLHVYGNLDGTYVTTIDNDQNTNGHVLKLLTDGNGSGSRLLEMEDGDGDIIFRARADGRFGFGPDGVSSMGAGTFVVGIDNSSHTSDIAISQRLQHLGDSNTYIDFPANDQMQFQVGGVDMIHMTEDDSQDKIVFNNGAADVDFIVKSPTAAKAIYLHSGNEVLHINHDEDAFKTKIHNQHGEAITVHQNGVVINDDGHATNDFRIESDTIDYMFFVDSGNNKVGIGTSGPDRRLDVLDASDPQLRLTHTDGSNYVDFKATAAGDLEIAPSNANGHVVVSSANNATMLIQSDDGGDSDAQIGFSVNAGSSIQWSLGCDDSDGDKFKIGTSLIETGTCITIDSTGNIGVGTTTPGSGFDVQNSFSLRVAGPKTSNYQLASDDICVTGDCNAGSITLTLPAATDAMTGRIYTVKRLDTGNSGGGNTLTVDRNSKLIDGVASDQVMGNKDALVFQCIGASAGWILIGSYMVPL